MGATLGVSPADRVAVPPGDPETYRAGAQQLTACGQELATSANTVSQASVGINPVWRSFPSSPRATSRLDAVSDLLRRWSSALDSAADALKGYGAALELAQSAARSINDALERTPHTTSMLGPRADPRFYCQFQEIDALTAADAQAAAALTEAFSGELSGTASTDRRIALADQAADAGPQSLTAMLQVAMAAQPPDLAAVEEALRQLGRKQNYTWYLASVMDGLGPVLTSLLTSLRTSGMGSDAAEMLGVLAVVAADLRAAGQPLPTEIEQEICQAGGISNLPTPAYVP